MAWLRFPLRRVSLLAAILLQCAGAVSAEQDASQILLGSLQPRPVVYVGEQVTELLGKSAPTRQQRVYRSATRLRIEFPGGQVVLDDGASQLRYFPRMKIVERGPSDLNRPRFRFVRKALESGRTVVERLPDDTVAARAAYVLLLRDVRGRRPPRRIWIDKENSIQLRQDVEQEGGRVQSTRFTSIRFGQEPPPAKMQPTWPANTPVVPRAPGRPIPPAAATSVARAWGGLLSPRFVPPGFRLRGYYQHGHNGRPRITTLFDDFTNQRVLSITQSLATPSPAPNPPQGPPPQPPRRSARKENPSVTELRGAARVTIAGPLAEVQLRQVLDSLQ